MAEPLLDRLDRWKGRFGTHEPRALERLLAQAARYRPASAAEAIRLHEALLFLRAYPASAEVARLADAALAGFATKVSDDEAFAAPEVSGIAGASISAVFTYEFATALAARHAADLEIGWDCYDDIERFGASATRLMPWCAEDWPVEAHTPFREWVQAAAGGEKSELQWILDRIGSAQAYDAMHLPLTWRIGDAASRSCLRLPARELFLHSEPLLRRSDVSLAREFAAPPLPSRKLSKREAAQVLGLIVDTSAMRYRELYGFSHPDLTDVRHFDAGRGVDIYWFGVPPEWRLPLRAYHAGMFFKNGVPAGYVETLSFADRTEVGFNLYYTFREGESAWIYAQVLRVCRQMLGTNCVVVDPYQIGHENDEALDSGAFWFYRKLGFRPLEPAIAKLVTREEQRMRATPGYRSSRATLKKLAAGYVVYETPEAQAGAWDRFSIRRLAIALEARGSREPLGLPGAPPELVHEKQHGSEARYLRLMQRHAEFRDALRELGSAPKE